MTNPYHPSRRTVLAASACALAPGVWAQQADAVFPSRTLTWVVPYPAGGFGDALSRMLAQKMGARLGQSIVVDNRPGAGGQIAAAFVKQQPADGHTLFYGDIGPFAMHAALYPKLGYDMAKDFAPLSRLFSTPLLVVVPSASRLASFADLVKAAGAEPGLNYGSYGIGSQPHIWTVMLNKAIQGKLNHIPYKGAAPALQDLMGGRLDVMCDVAPSSMPLVQSGKLRALAVVGRPHRLPQLPGIPTMGELGMPALDISGWNGMVVRAGTPAAIVARLHTELLAALESPDVVLRYTDLGLTVAGQSPQQFGAWMQSEALRWGAVIRDNGVVAE
nr:tripartite tricarboxylate transporter substrate binding protein [uncultured Albidiferax sp.]